MISFQSLDGVVMVRPFAVHETTARSRAQTPLLHRVELRR